MFVGTIDGIIVDALLVGFNVGTDKTGLVDTIDGIIVDALLVGFNVGADKTGPVITNTK